MIESVRLMCPRQERCIFCGEERELDARMACWGCRDGYAGWLDPHAPPFTERQWARLHYLLRQ